MRIALLFVVLATPSGCIGEEETCSDTGGVCLRPFQVHVDDPSAELVELTGAGACTNCYVRGCNPSQLPGCAEAGCLELGPGTCKLEARTADGRQGTAVIELGEYEETCCGRYPRNTPGNVVVELTEDPSADGQGGSK